jgi:hypothetical protein
VGASVGVFSTHPGHLDRSDAPDVDEILRCADAAMYAAKRAGGGVATTTLRPRSTSPGAIADQARPASSTLVAS